MNIFLGHIYIWTYMRRNLPWTIYVLYYLCSLFPIIKEQKYQNATLQTLIRALGLFKWARKRIIFQVTFLDIFTTFPFPSSWMNTLESLCVCFVYLFVFGSFHSSQLVTWNCRTSVLWQLHPDLKSIFENHIFQIIHITRFAISFYWLINIYSPNWIVYHISISDRNFSVHARYITVESQRCGGSILICIW